MKHILILLILVSTLSCKSQVKQVNDNNESFVKEELTIVEVDIINTFLDVELEKDLYKKYKNLEIFVIEESLKKTKPLSDYEFNYKYKNSWGSSITEWILDSLQIKKIKEEITNEEVYHWKVSDFKNLKVSLLKYEEFRKMINARSKKEVPSIGILYLSKPLIVDENNAFISFEIGNFQAVYFSTNHFTVLMRKINNKWVENGYYEDGVFN